MTKATTYNWDYLPEKYEKPGEFKPYKIKGDIIQALKTNREIELQNYKTRMNEGLSNMQLEAKEREMNLRAVNNAKKINEDRDLKELQSLTEAGKQLVLFGAKEWRKSQVKAGAAKWHGQDPATKAKLVAEMDEAWAKYQKNKNKVQSFSSYLRDQDPGSYAVLRDSLNGLSGVGVAEFQRNWVTSRAGMAGVEYNKILNAKTAVLYDGGEELSYTQLVKEANDGNKLAQDKIRDFQVEAETEVINKFTYLGGVQVADHAVIEKFVVPKIHQAQRTNATQQAAEQLKVDKAKAKQERIATTREFLNGNKTWSETLQHYVAGETTDEAPFNTKKYKEIVKNKAIDSIINDWKELAGSDVPPEYSIQPINSMLDSDAGDGKTVRQHLNERIINSSLQGTLDAGARRQAQHIATEKNVLLETGKSAIDQQAAKAGGFKDKNDANRAVAAWWTSNPEVREKLTIDEVLVLDNQLQKHAGSLTLGAQDAKEKALEVARQLDGNTITLQEAKARGDLSEETIEALVQQGLIVKGDHPLPPAERKKTPELLYKGATKDMKASGLSKNLDDQLNIAAIDRQINRLTQQYMLPKAQGGKDMSFKEAWDLSVAETKAQVEKELKMDSATLRREGKLIYQNRVNLSQSQAGEQVKNRVAALKAAKGEEIAPSILLDNEEVIAPLNHELSKIERIIANQSIPIKDLKKYIRDNSAFRKATGAIGGGLFSFQLVDKLLQKRNPHGIGLPKYFYSKRESELLRQHLNGEGATDSTNIQNNDRVVSGDNTTINNELTGQKEPLNDEVGSTLFGQTLSKAASKPSTSETHNTNIYNPKIEGTDSRYLDVELTKKGLISSGIGGYDPTKIHSRLSTALLSAAGTEFDLSKIREWRKFQRQPGVDDARGYDGKEKFIAVQTSLDDPLVQHITDYGYLYDLRVELKGSHAKIYYTGSVKRPDLSLTPLLKSDEYPSLKPDSQVNGDVLQTAWKHTWRTEGAEAHLYNGKQLWELPWPERQKALLQAWNLSRKSRRKPLTNITGNGSYMGRFDTHQLGWNDSPLGGAMR